MPNTDRGWPAHPYLRVAASSAAAVAPLTWSQRATWPDRAAFDTAPAVPHLPRTLRVPDRVDAEVGRLSRVVGLAERHAALRTYDDPATLASAFAARGHHLASALAPHCYVNDLRLPRESGPAPVADRAALWAATDRSVPTWLPAPDRFAWRCRWQVMDDPGGVALVVTADTGYLPPRRRRGPAGHRRGEPGAGRRRLTPPAAPPAGQAQGAVGYQGRISRRASSRTSQ